ncbi:MAG: hypothetical protein HY764_02055 [Candidatus Portnoybacteria bacterium]|nr:hypothetical protein [Candidatus Portnoybacteria bacterium]
MLITEEIENLSEKLSLKLATKLKGGQIDIPKMAQLVQFFFVQIQTNNLEQIKRFIESI